MYASSCDRDIFLRSTMFPLSSMPIRWNTVLPRSMPTVRILILSLLAVVLSFHHHRMLQGLRGRPSYYPHFGLTSRSPRVPLSSGILSIPCDTRDGVRLFQ